MKRIGLLGGTFDPVHFGHLRPALDVREALDLDEVRLLPCNVSPHRDPPIASGEHRRRMLELALAAHPGLHLDTRELERAPPSYAVDTLAQLLAEQPADQFNFVMGADAFAAFKRWHRWQEILELANVIVTRRAGHALADIGLSLAEPDEIRTARHGVIVACDVTALEISATRIRGLAAAGADISFLLPESVHGYIEQHALYRHS